MIDISEPGRRESLVEVVQQAFRPLECLALYRGPESTSPLTTRFAIAARYLPGTYGELVLEGGGSLSLVLTLPVACVSQPPVDLRCRPPSPDPPITSSATGSTPPVYL